MLDLRVVNIQEVNGSCFIYIPKIWVNLMALKKGEKMVWSINEGDHETLHLTKKFIKGDMPV